MGHAFHKIQTFRAEGTHFVLHFEDGKRQEVDFSDIAIGPLFEPLADPVFAESARLDTDWGTLVWSNGADFDPDFLYDWDQQSPRLIDQLKSRQVTHA